MDPTEVTATQQQEMSESMIQ